MSEKDFTTFTSVLRVVNPQVAAYLDMAAYKNMILDQYIGYQLVYKDASKEVKDKAAAEADEQYKQIEEAYTKETLETNMKDNNITAQDIKDFIRLSIGVSDAMAAKVTDADAQKYYDENKEGLTKVTLRHVLVGFTDPEGKERSKEDALARAKEAKAKLEADGADWNALAKEYPRIRARPRMAASTPTRRPAAGWRTSRRRRSPRRSASSASRSRPSTATTSSRSRSASCRRSRRPRKRSSRRSPRRS